METLNVRANPPSTTALPNNDNPPKQICLIPSSKIALRVRATDITIHYATHLRKAATRPELEKRFFKHYGWTSAQGATKNDWTAHHGAISKRRFAEKKFVLKMTYQILRMGKIFHTIDLSQSITCSSCKLHSESATHLYRCPTRCEAMEVFLNDTLPSFLQENYTRHRLAHTLLDALYSDLEDSFPEFDNRHGAHDTEFRRLHQLQAWAGWSQPFQGRLVHEWSLLQKAFLVSLPIQEQPDRKYYAGTIWTRKLISLLWDTRRAQNGTIETQTATVVQKKRATPSNTPASWNKSLSNVLEDLRCLQPTETSPPNPSSEEPNIAQPLYNFGSIATFLS